jgi:hypothetical protein
LKENMTQPVTAENRNMVVSFMCVHIQCAEQLIMSMVQ